MESISMEQVPTELVETIESQTITAGASPAIMPASSAGANRRTVLKGVLASGASALMSRLSLPAHAARRTEKKQARAVGKIREYWISADSYLNNLVPSGYDSMMKVTYAPDQTSFMGIGYRAYTPNWGAVLPGNADIGPNTGCPGPIIRAQVGDTIIVHFRNNDAHYKFPHSIHPHGVFYTPVSDGAWIGINPNKPGTAVKYGEDYTYEYTALESSVGTWPYHDHSVPQSIGDAAPDPELGAMLGLFGILAITDASTPIAQREYALVLHDVYQSCIPGLVQDFACFNGKAFLENTPVF